jgi:hypothetical protein
MEILSRYLRWKKALPESIPQDPEGSSSAEPVFPPQGISGPSEPMPEPEGSSPRLPAIMDVMIRYQNLLNSREWSEAAYLLYQYLIGRLLPIHGVSDPSTLTPREFAALLSSSSTIVSLQSFVGRYEEVRYEGLPLEKDDVLLTYWNEVLAVFETGPDNMNGRAR